MATKQAPPRVIELRGILTKFFEGIQFVESSHTYTYKGKGAPSVSAFIKDTGAYVDFTAIAKVKAEREGTTQKALLDQWKDKADKSIVRGNKTHDYAEKGYDAGKKPTTIAEEEVVKFLEGLPDHIHIVCKELRMFHKHWNYFGTTDLILWNELTDKLIVADYKTNEDLFKNYKGKMLLAPFEFLMECPFNKYQVQLNMYQLQLEQTRLEVEGRWIIWFPHEGGHKVFNEIIDLQPELIPWLHSKSQNTFLS